MPDFLKGDLAQGSWFDGSDEYVKTSAFIIVCQLPLVKELTMFQGRQEEDCLLQ